MLNHHAFREIRRLLNFLPYLRKTVWRHAARSALTVSGTAVSLTVFCCIGSVQDGMRSLVHDPKGGRTLIVFQENRFCPQSSRLPENYADTIRKIPGVRDVLPTKVFTNNCRASLDAIVFHGLPATLVRGHRRLTLLQGSWSAFERASDAALVGQAVAQRRRLRTGDKFTLGDISVQIAGVFRAESAADDGLIYTHLDFLQRARGRSDIGTVTQLEVQLDPQANPNDVATRIDTQFHSGPVATTTRTRGMFQAETLSDLAELIQFVHWLGLACVALVLSLVATTTIMAVQDRIKEHAVLQTIGLRPRQVFSLVVLESVTLCLLGGLAGVILSQLVLALGGFALSAEGITIAFRPSWSVALTGIAVSVVLGVVAGISPGWQAARAEIVPSLRHA